MSERETQCAVSAHRNAADGAVFPILANTVFFLDGRHELAQEEIRVQDLLVGRVDIERRLSFGRNDKEVTDLVLLAEIFDQIPSAGLEKRLLIVAQAMQVIKNRILSCRTHGDRGLVAGR